MFKWLFFIFILVPILELMILIEVGQHIGVLNTILLILTTAIVGVSLARWQGLQIFFKIQEAMNNQVVPTADMLDGLMVLVAAGVLLTPGLITDFMAFLFLIPATRQRIKLALMKYFEKRFQQNTTATTTYTVNVIDYTKDDTKK